MSNTKRTGLERVGRGSVGEAVVVGVRDSGTNKVRFRVTERATGAALQGSVYAHAATGANVYTDDNVA